jgi:hypothetical protein
VIMDDGCHVVALIIQPGAAKTSSPWGVRQSGFPEGAKRPARPAIFASPAPWLPQRFFATNKVFLNCLYSNHKHMKSGPWHSPCF